MTSRNGGSAAQRRSKRRRRRGWPPWETWLLDAELARALADVRRIRTPAARAWQATRLLGMGSELRGIRRDAVLELRRRGETWAEIAWLLHVTRARAWQLGREDAAATGRDGAGVRGRPTSQRPSDSSARRSGRSG